MPEDTIADMRDRRSLDLTLIGDRIAYARRKRGLTQQRLAEAIKDPDHPERISRIETGRRYPNVFAVAEIAKALRVTTDYILLGGPDPFDQSETTL